MTVPVQLPGVNRITLCNRALWLQHGDNNETMSTVDMNVKMSMFSQSAALLLPVRVFKGINILTKDKRNPMKCSSTTNLLMEGFRCVLQLAGRWSLPDVQPQVFLSLPDVQSHPIQFHVLSYTATYKQEGVTQSKIVFHHCVRKSVTINPTPNHKEGVVLLWNILHFQ